MRVRIPSIIIILLHMPCCKSGTSSDMVVPYACERGCLLKKYDVYRNFAGHQGIEIYSCIKFYLLQCFFISYMHMHVVVRFLLFSKK